MPKKPLVVVTRNIPPASLALLKPYFKIDYDAIWRVVTDDLPTLVMQLEGALATWQ